MKMKNLWILSVLCSAVLIAVTALIARPVLASSLNQAGDLNPPDRSIRLIFIHHSTGENWLSNGYGNLGRALDENNYYVSDTNYGWGPNSIGDRTDIPDWEEWFSSENTSIYLEALFNEGEQNADYSRTVPDPGGRTRSSCSNPVSLIRTWRETRLIPRQLMAGCRLDMPNMSIMRS